LELLENIYTVVTRC